MKTVQKFVICKICGYVMEEGRLKDKCPACGMKREMFEPYQSRYSEARERWLWLDFHPIIVHFSVAFTATFPILMVLAKIFPSHAPLIFTTARGMGLFLPVAALAGLVSGIIDGKVRFRKLATPVLVQKIIMGSALIINTAAITMFLIRSGFQQFSVVLFLGILALGWASLLGAIGSGLVCVKTPGT
jgi:hypothetical protein